MIAARLTSASVCAGGIAYACLLSASSPGAQEDILTRSRAKYASLKSYADTGTVVLEYGVSSLSRHTFKTYYRAPRHFYFDFTEDKADGGSRMVIWCDGGDFQAWSSETGLHNVYPKGQGAPRSSTAVSSPSAPTPRFHRCCSPPRGSSARLASSRTCRRPASRPSARGPRTS